MIFFSPPLARASKQEASNGLLDVGAAVDGGRDALGYRLVDVGHGSEATELLLLLRGHRASKTVSYVGKDRMMVNTDAVKKGMLFPSPHTLRPKALLVSRQMPPGLKGGKSNLLSQQGVLCASRLGEGRRRKRRKARILGKAVRRNQREKLESGARCKCIAQF